MRYPWILLFLCCTTAAFTQVKVNDQPLPQAGDAFLYYLDKLPSNIDPGKAGAGQRWNFMTLQAPFVRSSSYLTGRQGMNSNRFLEADLTYQVDEATEAYFRKDAEGLYLLGYYGLDPFGIGIRGLYRYDTPVLSQKKELEYGEGGTYETSMAALTTLQALPQSLRDLLPITPDSIRLRLVSRRMDEVDAWGTMLMPGGFFDVLREKRSEARSLRIETKVGSLPWQDITSSLPPNDVFGNHVFLTYLFYSENDVEPLMKIIMKADNQGVDRVVYQAIEPKGAIQDVLSIRPEVYAYPNPAIVNVRFEFTNLPTGEYQLSILNVLGIEIWSKDYFIQNDWAEKVDISFLKKGTYLYKLKNKEGKILTTRRLVVIRP